MKKYYVSLSGSEVNHILGLLEDRKRDGIHTDPAHQYFARTDRLIDRLWKAVREKPTTKLPSTGTTK